MHEDDYVRAVDWCQRLADNGVKVGNDDLTRAAEQCKFVLKELARERVDLRTALNKLRSDILMSVPNLPEEFDWKDIKRLLRDAMDDLRLDSAG
jgi:hypothetical protein